VRASPAVRHRRPQEARVDAARASPSREQGDPPRPVDELSAEIPRRSPRSRTLHARDPRRDAPLPHLDLADPAPSAAFPLVPAAKSIPQGATAPVRPAIRRGRGERRFPIPCLQRGHADASTLLVRAHRCLLLGDPPLRRSLRWDDPNSPIGADFQTGCPSRERPTAKVVCAEIRSDACRTRDGNPRHDRSSPSNDPAPRLDSRRPAEGIVTPGGRGSSHRPEGGALCQRTLGSRRVAHPTSIRRDSLRQLGGSAGLSDPSGHLPVVEEPHCEVVGSHRVALDDHQSPHRTRNRTDAGRGSRSSARHPGAAAAQGSLAGPRCCCGCRRHSLHCYGRHHHGVVLPPRPFPEQGGARADAFRPRLPKCGACPTAFENAHGARQSPDGGKVSGSPGLAVSSAPPALLEVWQPDS
jgi:hypothetical protein